VLLLAGAVQVRSRLRWYFWFSLLAILFTGHIFVAYANMNLSVPLSRFVLERFYLLGSAVADLRAYASALVTLGLLLALVGVGIANYADTDQSSNHLRTWKATAPMSSSSSCRL